MRPLLIEQSQRQPIELGRQVRQSLRIALNHCVQNLISQRAPLNPLAYRNSDLDRSSRIVIDRQFSIEPPTIGRQRRSLRAGTTLLNRLRLTQITFEHHRPSLAHNAKDHSIVARAEVPRRHNTWHTERTETPDGIGQRLQILIDREDHRYSLRKRGCPTHSRAGNLVVYFSKNYLFNLSRTR